MLETLYTTANITLLQVLLTCFIGSYSATITLDLIDRYEKKREERKQKVKNATPATADGIKFRSKLELYTYKKLKEAKIYNEYEQNRFELLPAFTFLGKKIRAMTYLPDFVGNNFIIECKGFANDAWPLREKLFKYKLFLTNDARQFYVLHNQKEVDNCINEILNYECNSNK